MMKMRLLIPSLLVLAASCGKDAEAVTQPDWSRTVYLQGEVDGGIEVLGDHLLQMTSSLLAEETPGGGAPAPAKENKKASYPVDIVIDSPGGSVTQGLIFMDVMHEVKRRGAKIRCWVPHLAASMAFQILTQCDERYGMPNSFYLWHRVRTFLFMAVVTGPAARDLSDDLLRADRLIVTDLLRALPISGDVVFYHLERETLHVGRQLVDLLGTEWISVDSAYGAILSVPENVPRPKRSGGFFDVLDTSRDYQITYKMSAKPK